LAGIKERRHIPWAQNTFSFRPSAAQRNARRFFELSFQAAVNFMFPDWIWSEDEQKRHGRFCRCAFSTSRAIDFTSAD